MFEPDKIGEWDAFVFETTGDLTTEGTAEKSPPMSPDGEKAFYDAIRGGKGFLGMHCATDTFGHHGPRNKGAEDPYIQMIGGEFVGHGAAAGGRDRDRRPQVPRHRRGIRPLRADPSASRTSGTPSRTCPTTCTSSWSRRPRG